MSEDNITKIILAIVGLLVTGIAITIYVRIKSKKNNNKVIIKNTKAGGDIAGRDINKER